MNHFDRARFFPMPLDQFRGCPFFNVGHDCKMANSGTIVVEMALLFLDANGNVTQRLAILLLTAFAGYKWNFRAGACRVAFLF